MRENYTTHLEHLELYVEHVHRFSLPTDRRAQLETGCWAGATEWHVTVSGEDYVESTHRAHAEKNLGRGRFSKFSRSVKIA